MSPISGSFPARALARLIDLVTSDPRGDKWRGIEADRHVEHGMGHSNEYYFHGVRQDEDTGHSPLAHAAARFLFALEVEMDKEDKT
jgi:hypothetical protein